MLLHSGWCTCICTLYYAGSSLSSLALDSTRQLLYFTDPSSGTINVLSTDAFKNKAHVLIGGAGDRPTAICFDSTNRSTVLLLLLILLGIISCVRSTLALPGNNTVDTQWKCWAKTELIRCDQVDGFTMIIQLHREQNITMNARQLTTS